MSCGSGNFTPDGTYDSLWDSVKPATLIDDLTDLADVVEGHEIHFHVDAAWGGPALFSTSALYRDQESGTVWAVLGVLGRRTWSRTSPW